MLGSLLKAAVGAVITPVAVVADVLTVGGVTTGKPKTYTSEALSSVLKNLENAAKPRF